MNGNDRFNIMFTSKESKRFESDISNTNFVSFYFCNIHAMKSLCTCGTISKWRKLDIFLLLFISRAVFTCLVLYNVSAAAKLVTRAVRAVASLARLRLSRACPAEI